MMPRLTTPFREKHPAVTFSVLSRTSIEVLSLLGNFDFKSMLAKKPKVDLTKAD